jgi:hypothetical protein|tara:strand:- start:418 stop:744 length:327 start_codon:yes stop_codon:yes gene_type:complete
MTSQYTKAMIQKIEAAEPLNLVKAKSLAAEFGMAEKYRSVISKAISLGLAYESAKPARKDGQPIAKKSDTVSSIAKMLGTDEADLVGLEKATRTGLLNLARSIARKCS